MHKLFTAIMMICIFMIPSMLSAQPKMEFQHSYFDFGYAPQNAELYHDFWLKSVGDKELVISNIKTGCSCTRAPLEKDVIAPGDSARLKIIFSTGRYKGRTFKRPIVETNEGSDRRQLTIIAQILTDQDSMFPLAVEPLMLEFLIDSDKSKRVKEIKITNNSEQDFDLNLVEFPENLLSIEFPESIPAGRTATAVVRLADKALNSEFKNSFTFELNDEDQTRYTVGIAGRLGTPTLKMNY